MCELRHNYIAIICIRMIRAIRPITRTASAVSVLKRCHVRQSVRLSVQVQRARQQLSRAAAGDAHRWMRMTRRPRRFWSDCKDLLQRTC